MSDVKTGWLVDFEDKPFAPKTLISQIHDDTTGENLATKLTALDGKKVDKVSGKGLSTNDYTTAEKNKLSQKILAFLLKLCFKISYNL